MFGERRSARAGNNDKVLPQCTRPRLYLRITAHGRCVDFCRWISWI